MSFGVVIKIRLVIKSNPPQAKGACGGGVPRSENLELLKVGFQADFLASHG